jgi:two-component system, NtrC family, nitrogen regulation response regulator GlnG
MNSSGGILVIDDDPSYLRALRRLLEGAGISPVETLPEGKDALTKIRSMRPDLVCLDLDLGEMDGREILPGLRTEWPDMGIVVVSGTHDMDVALECIRSGASDYLPKPFLSKALLQTVNRFRTPLPAAEPPPEPSLTDSGQNAFKGMLTNSPQMREIFRYASSVARSNLPILVTGETGTGKELAARALHQLRIPDGPFVAVNTAGLDDAMFSDSLFGHVPGAFTGGEKTRPGLIETAGDGTLFLDEIGDLSPASQVKLLRLLQESEYFPVGSDRPKRSRCRFVLATHKDLANDPGFRKDLYWRLCSHTLRLPPLRERREDLELLCRHFAAEAARQLGKPEPRPSEGFLRRLESMDFPGNIRELRGYVHDQVARCEGPLLDATDPPRPAPGLPPAQAPFPTLAQVQAEHIVRALERTDGNRTAAAELLGISRQTLITHLKKDNRTTPSNSWRSAKMAM